MPAWAAQVVDRHDPRSLAMSLRAVVIANFVQACSWQVDQAPEPGETRRALGFHSEAGGKGLNVAIGLQRLGVQVTPILAHGQDSAGEQLRSLLLAEGLDLSHVHALPMASGWGAGLIERNGQNRIAVFPGANDHLSPAHVRLAHAAIAQAQLVYGQFEVSLAATTEALVLAHAAGVRTVLNPSPWQTLPQALREVVHTHLVNESEAAELLGLDVPALLAMPTGLAALQARLARHQAFWLTHPGAQRVIITLGAMGSLAWLRDQPATWHCAAYPSTGTGDTVGCGDAFAAGFCWAETQGHGLQQALQLGNRCGAHLASHRGVLNALPRASQLQAWL